MSLKRIFDGKLKKIAKGFTLTLIFAGSYAIHALEAPLSLYGNVYAFMGYRIAQIPQLNGTDLTQTEMLYSINNFSNLGVRFKYKQYDGLFELNFGDFGDDKYVLLRKAYGNYKFDYGVIKIGQDWQPYTNWSHNYANNNQSSKFGALASEPAIQAQYSFQGFYLTVLRPYIGTKSYTNLVDVGNLNQDGGSITEYKTDKIELELTTKQDKSKINSLIPKVAAGYDFASRGYSAGIGGAYNIIKFSADIRDQYDRSVLDSYLVYLRGGIQLMPFFVKAHVGYSVNPANIGVEVVGKEFNNYTPGAAIGLFNIKTGKIELKDTQHLQGYLEFGYQYYKDWVLFVGGGYSGLRYAIPGAKDDHAYQVYVNSKIKLRNLMAIAPSVSYVDFLKDTSGNAEGTEVTFGILVTISFY